VWRRGRALAIVGVGGTIVLTLALLGVFDAQSADDAEPAIREKTDTDPASLSASARMVSKAERADAIVRAQVWRAPATPLAQASFAPAGYLVDAVDCRFQITELGGTTPKFHCLLASGREIRVKYGPGAEIPIEAAATRLLTAIGFGADTISLVERLRCYGCPREPFVTMKLLDAARARHVYEKVMDPQKHETFERVAMEQKFPARPIEGDGQEGWAFFELDTVDPAKGGAPRAHVDALRLLAVFLAHWDNKAENQRLVCLSQSWPDGTPCREPFLLLQDVGSLFGPKRLDLEAWRRAAIWKDRAACTVSMRDFPYDGGTFGSARITEAGRQFLGTRLAQLTDRQLTDLFSSARFDQPRSVITTTRPVAEWVQVFKQRVKTITDGPPCADP
jgi:hypothetical protein